MKICICENAEFAIFRPISIGYGEDLIEKYKHLWHKPICFDCGGTRDDVDPQTCDCVSGSCIAARLEELASANLNP